MEDEAMLPKSIATYLVYFLVRFPNAEFAMLSKKNCDFPRFLVATRIEDIKFLTPSK